MTLVTVIGNVGSDPIVRFTPSGKAVCGFNVAVAHRRKVDDRWVDESTDWYRVSAWDDLAHHVADSLEKGARVIVSGRLRQRSWEDDKGVKRLSVELTADDVGPSLRWATAQVQKAERKAPTEDGGGGQPAFDPADEPF